MALDFHNNSRLHQTPAHRTPAAVDWAVPHTAAAEKPGDATYPFFTEKGDPTSICLHLIVCPDKACTLSTKQSASFHPITLSVSVGDLA